jgi:hypothetical protein
VGLEISLRPRKESTSSEYGRGNEHTSPGPTENALFEKGQQKKSASRGSRTPTDWMETSHSTAKLSTLHVIPNFKFSLNNEYPRARRGIDKTFLSRTRLCGRNVPHVPATTVAMSRSKEIEVLNVNKLCAPVNVPHAGEQFIYLVPWTHARWSPRNGSLDNRHRPHNRDPRRTYPAQQSESLP